MIMWFCDTVILLCHDPMAASNIAWVHYNSWKITHGCLWIGLSIRVYHEGSLKVLAKISKRIINMLVLDQYFY